MWLNSRPHSVRVHMHREGPGAACNKHPPGTLQGMGNWVSAFFFTYAHLSLLHNFLEEHVSLFQNQWSPKKDLKDFPPDKTYQVPIVQRGPICLQAKPLPLPLWAPSSPPTLPPVCTSLPLPSDSESWEGWTTKPDSAQTLWWNPAPSPPCSLRMEVSSLCLRYQGKQLVPSGCFRESQ